MSSMLEQAIIDWSSLLFELKPELTKYRLPAESPLPITVLPLFILKPPLPLLTETSY